MNTENATLKDIARVLGVSPTTVHRALQGKGGVGDELRERIQSAASDMGYRSNYMAAALKRKSTRIAIALPEPSMENRYYYFSLWLGARQFLESVREFHLESQEFHYSIAVGSHGDALKHIYEKYSDDIDGLLTIPVEHPQSSYFIEKFAEKKIPVALVGADLYKESRFCCVKTYDEMAGSMAAELLTAFQPGRFHGKIVVTGNLTGDLAMLDQYYNAKGFEEYIAQHAPGTQLLTAYNADAKLSARQLQALLTQHSDIFAVYACSARHTVQMCDAVAALGLEKRVKLIGNDYFPESTHALRSGILTAIIDKKITRQSFLAMQALFNFAVKSEYPAAGTLYVRPTVVLRSNLEQDGVLE